MLAIMRYVSNMGKMLVCMRFSEKSRDARFEFFLSFG